jgi:nicotinamide phosphoribosyltransferase
MAMKATYGVFGGKTVPIFKDPKTDNGGLKKSQKGCCRVWYDAHTNLYTCTDCHSEWVPDEETLLIPVFKVGYFPNKQNFHEIRTRLQHQEVA